MFYLMRIEADLVDSPDLLESLLSHALLAFLRAQSLHPFPNLWGYLSPDFYILITVSSKNLNMDRRYFKEDGAGGSIFYLYSCYLDWFSVYDSVEFFFPEVQPPTSIFAPKSSPLYPCAGMLVLVCQYPLTVLSPIHFFSSFLTFFF